MEMHGEMGKYRRLTHLELVSNETKSGLRKDISDTTNHTRKKGRRNQVEEN